MQQRICGKQCAPTREKMIAQGAISSSDEKIVFFLRTGTKIQMLSAFFCTLFLFSHNKWCMTERY